MSCHVVMLNMYKILSLMPCRKMLTQDTCMFDAVPSGSLVSCFADRNFQPGQLSTEAVECHAVDLEEQCVVERHVVD